MKRLLALILIHAAVADATYAPYYPVGVAPSMAMGQQIYNPYMPIAGPQYYYPFQQAYRPPMWGMPGTDPAMMGMMDPMMNPMMNLSRLAMLTDLFGDRRERLRDRRDRDDDDDEECYSCRRSRHRTTTSRIEVDDDDDRSTNTSGYSVYRQRLERLERADQTEARYFSAFDSSPAPRSQSQSVSSGDRVASADANYLPVPQPRTVAAQPEQPKGTVRPVTQAQQQQRVVPANGQRQYNRTFEIELGSTGLATWPYPRTDRNPYAQPIWEPFMREFQRCAPADCLPAYFDPDDHVHDPNRKAVHSIEKNPNNCHYPGHAIDFHGMRCTNRAKNTYSDYKVGSAKFDTMANCMKLNNVGAENFRSNIGRMNGRLVIAWQWPDDHKDHVHVSLTCQGGRYW